MNISFFPAVSLPPMEYNQHTLKMHRLSLLVQYQDCLIEVILQLCTRIAIY